METITAVTTWLNGEHQWQTSPISWEGKSHVKCWRTRPLILLLTTPGVSFLDDVSLCMVGLLLNYF